MASPARMAARLLWQSARAYAIAAVEELAKASPEIVAHGLPATFADPIEDTRMRLLALAESLDVDRPDLLAHQIAWYKVALAHRGVAAAYLPHNLAAVRRALRSNLPSSCHADVDRHLDVALRTADTAPTELPSLLEGDGPHRDLARRFLLAILENRRQAAIDLVMAAHAGSVATAELQDHVLALTQREVGRMWAMGEIPIADEHYASRVVEHCLDRLEAATPRPPQGHLRVLTAAVGGDLHGIGLRLVGMRLAMAGFEVLELGADMPASDFEWLLQDRRVDVIALGATLVLNVSSARATIERLRHLGAGCPPILVGGAPFTIVPDLHAVIGADAAATDAATAVHAVEMLLQQRCRAPDG